jgi:hypothetical protein
VWSTQKKPREEGFLTPLTPFGTTNGESFQQDVDMEDGKMVRW